MREADEWFDDDPDDIPRLERVLASITEDPDPIVTAAALMARIARAQAFGEGNKRTSLVVGSLYLELRGVDPRLIDSDAVRRLLVQASVGTDVEADLLAALRAG